MKIIYLLYFILLSYIKTEFIPIKMIFVSNNQPKSLTLCYPSQNHAKEKKLVIDVDFPEDLDKIYFALDFDDNYD